MTVMPTLAPPPSAAPASAGPAPPGAPPPGTPFEGALAEHWARTANAEGQKQSGADGRSHKSPSARSASAEDGAPAQVSAAPAPSAAPVANTVASQASPAPAKPSEPPAPEGKPSVAANEAQAPAEPPPVVADPVASASASGEEGPAVTSKPQAELPSVQVSQAGHSEADSTPSAPAAVPHTGASGVRSDAEAETQANTSPTAIATPPSSSSVTGAPQSSGVGQSSLPQTDPPASTHPASASQPSTVAGPAVVAQAVPRASSPPMATNTGQAPSEETAQPVAEPAAQATSTATQGATVIASSAVAQPDLQAVKSSSSNTTASYVPSSEGANEARAPLPSTAADTGSGGGRAGQQQKDTAAIVLAHELPATSQAPGADAASAVEALTTTLAPASATPGAQSLGAGVGMQEMIDAIRATIDLAARQGLTQARIALQPAELGEIRIHLSQSADGLTARVTADTPAAAQALAQGHSELHESLSSLGLSLLRLDIGSFGQPQGGEREARFAGSSSQTSASRTSSHEDGDSNEPVGQIDGTSASLSPSSGRLVDVLA